MVEIRALQVYSYKDHMIVSITNNWRKHQVNFHDQNNQHACIKSKISDAVFWV